MKKAISIGIIGVIVSAMLLAAMPVTSAKLWGDANEDGKINMGDVTFVERIIVWLEDETELADANQDGNINMGDVTYIELIILGRAPFPGGTLVAATLWDPSTLTAANVCGGVSPYGTNIYEPLVFVDNDMNLQPELAKSWKRLDDYTWRFYLREGVKFHDGTTFDADAAKFSFDRLLSDPLVSMFLGGDLYIDKDSIKVVDDYTIDITTGKPLGNVPGILANARTVMISPNIDELGEPCGTGPFKFEEMIPMQTLDVVRNEQYWGDGPKLEKLIIKTIFDPSTKVMALEAGEVDLIYGVPRAEVSSLEANPDIQVFKRMMPSTTALYVNAKRALLSDVRVRKAINYAINKEDIVEYILEGIGQSAKSTVSPVILWSADDELEGYPYSPAKAEELLADAGWVDTDGDGYLDKNGKTLEIDFVFLPTMVPEHQPCAEAIQDQLKDVGIKVELVSIEWGSYWDILVDEQFDMFLDIWFAIDGDGSSLLHEPYHSEGGIHVGYNLSKQALVDELIDVGRATSDPDIAAENFCEVQKIVMDEEAAAVPLIYDYEVVAAKNSVKEFEIHPLTLWGITMKNVYNTE